MDIKGKKIGVGLAIVVIILVALIIVLAAIILPFATVVIIINMIYNKGAIDFSPKKQLRPIRRSEPFEKIKI